MSEKRMVYAEDVIQRIRDLAPEILGGWYNPDMENELEQLVCVVENTPTAAAQDAQRWRYTAEEPPKEEDGDCCGRVLIAHADNIHTKAQLANFAYKAWLIEHTEEAEKAKKTEELLTELISYGVMKGVIRNDE